MPKARGGFGVDGRLQGDHAAGDKRNHREQKSRQPHGRSPLHRLPYASAAIFADTILSGLAGGSPRLI